MKKIIKWVSIVVGVLVFLLIVAAVALPFVLPLEKIKEFATAKLSEAINRQVRVEKVSFNLFTGIKLENLSISNRPGFAQKPFVSADAIALRYAFWPLFKKQIVIKEVRLVKPEILIEKNAAGEFNFSDMLPKKGAPAEKKPEVKTKGAGKQAFSLVVDTFSIRNGRITYADYGTKTSTGLKNANLTVSGVSLAMDKPIGLDFSAVANYQKKDIPLAVAGKIDLDLAKEIIRIPGLALSVAGEKATISTTLSQFSTGPSLDFSIVSSKLSVDPLLSIFTAGATAPKPKAAPVKGELTRTINQATAAIPATLKIKGNIDIGNFSFQAFKVDRINVGATLVNKRAALAIKEIAFYEGKLSGQAAVNLAAPGLSYSANNIKLENFNSTPFVNTVVETFLSKMQNYKDMVNKVYGRLNMNVSLSGSGVEPEDILKNAAGSGSFALTGGEIKRTQILAQIGQTIKSNSLQEDLKFDELSGEFDLKNQIVNVKKFKLEGGDARAGFAGGVDIGGLKWVSGNRLSLKLSPAATRGLSKEFDLFRDEKGWFELTFEMTGSLTKPIPKPILDKPAEKIKQKVEQKVDEKKKELEAEAKRKADEEKKRLEEEAKKKLEEEAKNKLKNMLKF
jgi:uncharacterized protein involved in outer membrane biogenesis